MSDRIAVVGLGLRYPDADDVTQYWENTLGCRRAFRELPDERMNKADYWAEEPDAPDRFYTRKAAVLRNFEFDRAGFKISGSTYRATDLTHWLALTVAKEALDDAGVGNGIDPKRVGVVLGNSLTGEFSRANLMRLRWPYVRRTLAKALAETGLGEEEVAAFLTRYEASYKEPFPAVGEDSLAGGLANTIAGRICNYFDFRGGGYTVDGACSSSLLSIINAARSLLEGDIDVALAGGVDLSIDPFEVIGFAKTGALARSTMKVYDADSNGFWPGEGCGITVLMREEDARAAGAKIYALLSGWGMSSDGKGGITRPEADGHRDAIAQAYRRAGYSLASVDYLEGHGTGTAVGDETEIKALGSAMHDAGRTAPVALSSVKAMIGHTKAAAGIAGFIRACLALHHRTLPPGTGQMKAHPALAETVLEVPRTAAEWTGETPRAGVSAMGFGGINTHVTLEADHTVPGSDRRSWRGQQDHELLVASAATPVALATRLRSLAERVRRFSYSEVTDLAAELAQEPAEHHRAALVVSSPESAVESLLELAGIVEAGTPTFTTSLFYSPVTQGRVGLMFPGQGGTGSATKTYLGRRFPELTTSLEEPAFQTPTADTRVAQPRIVSQSIAGLEVLHHLGIEGSVAFGHSLGELAAIHWGGALEAGATVDLARARGKIMGDMGQSEGGMASLNCGAEDAERHLAAHQGADVFVAGYNGPHQTVISGNAQDVSAVARAVRDAGTASVPLQVSHAFHSPHMASAAESFKLHLASTAFATLHRSVYSTVSGQLVATDDIAEVLGDQLTSPVRFTEAVRAAAGEVDLFLEVGPGQALTGMAKATAPDVPRVAFNVEAGTEQPLLQTMAACYVVGAVHELSALFADRVHRTLPEHMEFLASPCESAPPIAEDLIQEPGPGDEDTQATAPPVERPVVEVLREAIATKVELPVEAVDADANPLDDLHLSSITISQIMAEVARDLGKAALPAATNFATATVAELAETLANSEAEQLPQEVVGAEPWVRSFCIAREEAPLPEAGARSEAAPWHVSTGPEWDATGLAELLQQAEIGPGTLLVLGRGDDLLHPRILATAQKAIASDHPVVFVQPPHAGLGGLARSFALENRDVPVILIESDETTSDPAWWADTIGREVSRAGPGYTEALYRDGARLRPVLRALSASDEPAGTALCSSDVLLASGGGKGIVAESAIAMAQRYGCSLGIIGRTAPQDPELVDTFARLHERGISFHYVAADITSAPEVEDAVAEIEREQGPITGVLHGAGRNVPMPLGQLTREEINQTVAVKNTGLTHILSALSTDLKLLVGFGSIIGRAGLEGEAHYAAANELMTSQIIDFGRKHPHTQCHALEWSVWSGTGMGERLGVLEQLRSRGITPISTDAGIAELIRLIEHSPVDAPVVVASRVNDLPTIRREQSTGRPLRRFLEKVLVDYPGVEVVTEVTLTHESDPYLVDHELDGDFLFPAVMGIEGMMQVAEALAGEATSMSMHDAQFLRPIAVPAGQELTLRLAGVRRRSGEVVVAIRSEETGFSADHFRATFRHSSVDQVPPVVAPTGSTRLGGDQLYGDVLFQGARFQRLCEYRHVGARAAVAVLDPVDKDPWFAMHLPQDRVLGSPGVRDALMHALQCCVPNATLLPGRVQEAQLASDFGSEPVTIYAREVGNEGDEYVYDVVAVTESGEPVEWWRGLHLHAVRHTSERSWHPQLLGPITQRAFERIVGGSLQVGIEARTTRPEGTQAAVCRAAGHDLEIFHRGDGKPELASGFVSVTHSGDLTAAAIAECPVACDMERVVERPATTWRDMLGSDLSALAELIAHELEEPIHCAATRVWGVLESVRKLGRFDQTIVFNGRANDDWSTFQAGGHVILSGSFFLHGENEPLVITIGQ